MYYHGVNFAPLFINGRRKTPLNAGNKLQAKWTILLSITIKKPGLEMA
jgi:hypothetical protein